MLTKNPIQLDHTHHQPGKKRYPLCLWAHNAKSPENVGSFFRVADALGVEKIYLSGSSPVPPNKKITKTSRSADKYVPYHYEASWQAVLQHLQTQEYRPIGLEITDSSLALQDFTFAKAEKLCLVLGEESGGISEEILCRCDLTLHIPMLGTNSSMNVANASAIACFVITQKMQEYTRSV